MLVAGLDTLNWCVECVCVLTEETSHPAFPGEALDNEVTVDERMKANE